MSNNPTPPDPLSIALEALRKIAKAEPPTGDCTCGHVQHMCHKFAANRYCGGATSWAVWEARAAIEEIDAVVPVGVCSPRLTRDAKQEDA